MICAVKSGPFLLRGFKKDRSDYAGVAEVATAVRPEYPTTVAELRSNDARRDPELVFGRIVAELAGRIVAYGAYGQAEGALWPGKFFLNAAVHPDHRRRGLGGAIYDRVLDTLAPQRPGVLAAFAYDDRPDALRFLERRGFEVVLRRPVLRLDLRAFDPARFRPGKPDPGGPDPGGPDPGGPAIEIAALSDLMATVPDWQRRCWDLDWEVLRDIPSAEPPRRLSFERYLREFEAPDFAPESWFVARHAGDWVGMSLLTTDPATPGTFYTAVTGVRRGYRRRGIATALKLHGIAHVRARGGQVIETDNEEHNPMLALNLALGFEPGPTFLEFRKTL